MSAGGSLKKQVQKAQGAPTNAQQASLDQRLGIIEAKLEWLLNTFRGEVNKLAQRLAVTNQALAAACEVLGIEAVTAKAQEMQIRELENESAQLAAQVAEAVEKGELSAASQVVAGSPMVVTTQTGADGVVKHPTCMFLPLEGYTPEVQTLLEGRAVGETIELPHGDKLTVVAAYTAVEQRDQLVGYTANEASAEATSSYKRVPATTPKSELEIAFEAGDLVKALELGAPKA